MKLSIYDWFFLIGLLLIIIPVFLLNWLFGSIGLGVVFVTLSLVLGRKGGGG